MFVGSRIIFASENHDTDDFFEFEPPSLDVLQQQLATHFGPFDPNDFVPWGSDPAFDGWNTPVMATWDAPDDANPQSATESSGDTIV